MRSTNLSTAITRCLIVACGAFLVLMCAVCMLVLPEIFQHPNYGVSYFGTQRATLIPYYGGFAIVIGCLLYVSRLLWSVHGSWRFMRSVFLLTAIASCAIAITSYPQQAGWSAAHYTACAAQLLIVLIAAGMILRLQACNWMDTLAAILIVVDGAIIILHPSWQQWIGTYALREIALFLLSLFLLGRAAQRATAN